MERFILKKLLDWKNSPYRKPLILKGVRQVGKTWILKEFGRRCYENTAYFNFDENEEYKQFFETTKDVDRILQNLMMAEYRRLLRAKERGDLIKLRQGIYAVPEALLNTMIDVEQIYLGLS